MNKLLLTAGGITAAVVVLYFVFRKKKEPQKDANTSGGGGAFTPKILGPEDWSALEKVFISQNPYNNEKALFIEGQAEDETAPRNAAGTQKTLVTKAMFDNLTLALIRQHIGAKSGWIQEVETNRFNAWDGTARAGYANSLAQAWAYVARVYIATNNYYSTGPTPATTQTGIENLTAAQQAVKNNGGIDANYYKLDWKATNTANIYKFTNASAPGGPITIFWSIPTKTIVSVVTARQQGYDGR